jgi:YfiH family protein
VTLIRPDWPAPARVQALVTTRGFADMARNSGGAEKILQQVPSAPVWLKQVHGTTVVNADQAKAEGAEPEADAAIAHAKATVCAVRVADCMPVFLAHEAGEAVGVAHAGWRGLSAGVLEATVAALGVPAGRLVAWLGPAIGPRVYEVGNEVRDAFLSQDARAHAAFVASRPGHWLLDLYAVARQRLERCGVTRIHGGGFCTYSEPERFFSYRRNYEAGRMAALIWVA